MLYWSYSNNKGKNKMSESHVVGMKDFQKILSSVSSDTTICVRGRHAVGKSEGVYQGAVLRKSDFYKNPENCERMIKALGGAIRFGNSKEFVTSWTYDMGLPVIERRLSQMTEGDIIGLPILDSQARSTQFKPCDWLIQACDFPAVLFLDERNRALDAVKQAVFQLADSKMFYGNRLHPETIVSIAENIGEQYSVNQTDPAEISRAATVTLEPSVEEYLEHIGAICNLAMVEFLRQNPARIEHNGVFEPNKKYPDRRTWVKLDGELQKLDLYNNPNDHLLYTLTGAFCGTEVASLFKSFCVERNRHVSAKEILTNWNDVKGRMGRISNDMYVELVQKIKDHLTREDKEMSAEEALELSRFMHDAPGDMRIATWAILTKNQKNVIKILPHIRQLLVDTINGESGKKAAAVVEKPESEDSTEKVAVSAKRGPREL